jgi:integrase
MSGTPTLDLIVPGVGRIHRHIGTRIPGKVAAVRSAIRECVERGRLDVLERLRDGLVTPLEVYDAFSRGVINQLTAVDPKVSVLLLPKLEEFERIYPQSEAYRRDIKGLRVQVAVVGRKGARLSELPDLLRTLKGRYERKAAATTFNRHKRIAMSFASWALGQSESPLWDEIRRVPSMPYKRPDKPGLTVAEFRTGVAKLPAAHAAIAWSLVLSGMNWKEYTVDGWSQDPEAGTVRVHGKKRGARERVLPYLAALHKPDRAAKAFRGQVHAAFGPEVTPHTFRRSYIQWAEKAGVPRFFVKMYCGHTVPLDVTTLYENEALTAEAMADHRKKLVAYIGRPLGLVALAVEARSA